MTGTHLRLEVQATLKPDLLSNQWIYYCNGNLHTLAFNCLGFLS